MKLDIENYSVTDDFFGAPFVDADEQRDDPTPHRYIHGGFEGTDTRFAFFYPPAERYEGRMFKPLQGGNAGDEHVNCNPHGTFITGGIEMIFRLGGYAVESNMGHIGDVLDPKAGEDPTIYGWRAVAESARFSKFLAARILGKAPDYTYVYGGSGGARRSPLCLAYAPDVFDGAMPFMGDASDGDHGDFSRIKQGAGHFASMFNVQRVLGPKMDDVIDAMWPGGSGNPFATLNTHQIEELSALYRLGYPRGDEFMISQPMGQIWLWASMAERLQGEDDYFDKFWTTPGHVGYDQPDLVAGDLLSKKIKVARALTTQNIYDDPIFSTPKLQPLLALVRGVIEGTGRSRDLPCVLEIKDVGEGYRLGAKVKITSGTAEGRELYCLNAIGDYFFCDGMSEASNLRFTGVEPGDEVHIDNRAFLAYCYYARHHLQDTKEYDFLRLAGRPIYKQYELPDMSPFMSTCHTGKFDGKMLWIHHTHDSSLWPSQGIGMKNNVEREVGYEEGRKHFRLRWLDNAEHIPPMLAAAPANRANVTWLVDYLPMVEQGLVDLAAWVEQGIEPAETQFEYLDGEIILSSNAVERGGVQPVVAVTANGKSRAEVKAGKAVNLEVSAEVPAGTGTIISVLWDFDGSGSYPEKPDVDGTASKLTLNTQHTYDKPGTYFVTALVESHREGDVNATCRRIPNVASARVVVA